MVGVADTCYGCSSCDYWTNGGYNSATSPFSIDIYTANGYDSGGYAGKIQPVTGYDIVVLAGQSNSCSNAGADAMESVYDRTDGYPIVYLSAGNGDWSKSAADSLRYPRGDTIGRLPSSDSIGNVQFGSMLYNFTKRYVDDGNLVPGRAVMMVPTCFSGIPMSHYPSSFYGLAATLPNGVTVQQTWAPDSTCSGWYGHENGLITDPLLNTLPSYIGCFGYSTYRIDLAMSVDPSTGIIGTSLPSPNSANKVVALLWSQGEADQGSPIANWAGCLKTVITTWRGRYGSTIPFLATTYTPNGGNQMIVMADFLRYNFGNGAFAADNSDMGYLRQLTLDQQTAIALNLPYLGLADTFYDVLYGGSRLSYNYDPGYINLQNVPHFSVLGYQIMGGRHYTAYQNLFTTPSVPPPASPPPPPPVFSANQWNFVGYFGWPSVTFPASVKYQSGIQGYSVSECQAWAQSQGYNIISRHFNNDGGASVAECFGCSNCKFYRSGVGVCIPVNPTYRNFFYGDPTDAQCIAVDVYAFGSAGLVPYPVNSSSFYNDN